MSFEPSAGFTLKIVGSLGHELVGTWRLLSRLDRDASGEPVHEPTLGSDPLALLFFDGAGNFAAQFMKRDRSAAMEAPVVIGQNNTTAIGGYDAYFGTYEVDETSGDVHTRLVGALSPGHVGGDHDPEHEGGGRQADHPADHDHGRRHAGASNPHLGAGWLTHHLISRHVHRSNSHRPATERARCRETGQERRGRDLNSRWASDP